MTGGDREDKRQHLLTVLTQYLAARLDQVIDKLPSDFDQDATVSRVAEAPLSDLEPMSQSQAAPAPVAPDEMTISQEEIDRFLQSELPRLDNDGYFRQIFG